MCITICHPPHCHVYLQPGPPGPSIPQTQPAAANENRKLSPRRTQISPTKNALIEPQFEHRSLIYLDQQIIIEACLDDLLTRESGFYATEEVHIRVVDDLFEQLEELPDIPNGIVAKRPSKDSLEKIHVATIESLKMGIKYIEEKAPKVQSWEDRKEMALEKASLQALLLHGQDCVLLKSKDLGTRKVIAFGRLSFGSFDCFSISLGDKELFFGLKDKDIVSGKFLIEGSDAAEWESFVKVEALPHLVQI